MVLQVLTSRTGCQLRSPDLANPHPGHLSSTLGCEIIVSGKSRSWAHRNGASWSCKEMCYQLGLGFLHLQQGVFTKPAGPGTWSGFSKMSQCCFQSGVIKCACPDERLADQAESHRPVFGCLLVYNTKYGSHVQVDSSPLWQSRKTCVPEAHMR